MTMTSLVHKHAHAILKGVSRDQREIRFVATRYEIDRDGEVIDPNGLDVDDFKRNPVMLREHDRYAPVGRVVALTLTVVDGAPAWTGLARLDPPGTSAEADQTYKQINAGSLNGISIGFQVQESSPRAVLPGQTGPTYKKAKLLEISLVTIPSCANCLVLEKALRKEHPMSECACQQTDVIDWAAINRSLESQNPEVDLDSIFTSREGLNIDPRDVDQVIAHFVPALRDGVRMGLRLQAQVAVQSAINRMTGRLD